MTGSNKLPTEAVWLRRGVRLEWVTLLWNVVGVATLTVLAITASSVALAGFGIDSFIEIGASCVVLWELSGAGQTRQRRGLLLIAIGFGVLAVYLTIQSTIAVALGHHALASVGGIVWTAVTAVVMFALAAGKSKAGRILRNPVLAAEGRVTFVDGLLASAVLAGLALDSGLGWWWADPVAGYVIVFYAIRETHHILRELRTHR